MENLEIGRHQRERGRASFCVDQVCGRLWPLGHELEVCVPPTEIWLHLGTWGCDGSSVKVQEKHSSPLSITVIQKQTYV